MSDRIHLSVVIVSWNVCDLLRICLRSIPAGTRLPPEQVQVLVVDNHSSDGSAELVAREFPEVELLANAENLGFARANNQAFPRCRGEILLLLNPDTEVLPDSIDVLMDLLLQRQEVGAVGCQLVDAQGKEQRWTAGALPSISSVAGHYLFLDRLLPERLGPTSMYQNRHAEGTREVGWVSGACMALRRSALGDRLFDERFFMYAEDMELCWRLAQQGAKIVYTDSAKIVHHHGRSMDRQPSLDIQLSAIRAPRSFFVTLHGKAWLWMYDLITLAGYVLRWFLYRVMALTRPRGGFGAKAALCRHHAAMVLRVAVRG